MSGRGGKPETVLAGGAVVWRRAPGGDLEVLIVHRPRYNDWSWPKGKLEDGEHLPVCAVREVTEETGVAPTLGQFLSKTVYRLNGGNKEVSYWLARPGVQRGPARARGPVNIADLSEIDLVKWVPLPQALKELTQPSDQELGRKIEKLFQNAQAHTSTLIITRHGKAKRREKWTKSDASRPLKSSGIAQAQSLTGIYSAFGVNRIFTSPWERCASTVSPYARAARIKVEEIQLLSEAGWAANQAAVEKWLAQIVHQLGDKPAPDTTNHALALCTHRPVLASLLAALHPFLAPGVKLENLTPEQGYLKVGQSLIVHIGNIGGKPAIINTELC